mmetsp:Transcript_18891/g.27792  ORF Transcript_18891/g.27792 Transcript_18891/m.27792 type:complete len:86 (-) Transcript_18891:105-362(-)
MCMQVRASFCFISIYREREQHFPIFKCYKVSFLLMLSPLSMVFMITITKQLLLTMPYLYIGGHDNSCVIVKEDVQVICLPQYASQ